ncbi:MAG: type II secretion system minor pseudopilin GspJ [Haliea sp.]|nr:type II secretion system minor pseudopilin GspJ [Haliea sp.]
MLPRATARAQGFTLVEVLIALAITAFVAAIAYAGLSTVISGVESTRGVAERTWEVNRALQIVQRDLRELVDRPVRDEFGDEEPALMGGPAARFLLSFTRTGWHNPTDQQRSTLQRVNYVWLDDSLWRESYWVLDRAGSTEPRRVRLLTGVARAQITFLQAVDALGPGARGTEVDTRNWPDNWVVDTSQPGARLALPAALELTLELEDLGELRMLHALPPL